MADDLATAMRAGRCERVDRAFEGVERVSAIPCRDSERLVIVIAAHFALCHRRAPLGLAVVPSLRRISAGSPCRSGSARWPLFDEVAPESQEIRFDEPPHACREPHVPERSTVP